VPAPAVIPAPIAYIKVAAVKKLVVGTEDCGRPAHRREWCGGRPVQSCLRDGGCGWFRPCAVVVGSRPQLAQLTPGAN
jgi:hypothetical protein